MGRGRAKAKQTKVARNLKYQTHETDFGALARELHGEEANHSSNDSPDEDGSDEPADDHSDDWSDYSQASSRD